MRIEFQDSSYVEIDHALAPGKIILAISAKNPANPLITIVNSVELDYKQLQSLFGSVLKPIVVKQNKKVE
jgi:hypothetical protein